MASLIRADRTGLYYVQFYDATRNPTRKKVPLKTKRKRVAERALAKLEDAVALGQLDPWRPDPDETEDDVDDLSLFGNAVEAYLASCAHLKPRTIQTYKEIVCPSSGFCGSCIPVKMLGLRCAAI